MGTMPFPLWHFALGTFSLLRLGGCDICNPVCGAQAPGDILIGVISSINAQVEDLNEREQPEPYTCRDFIAQSFVETLAVVHTIDVINKQGFLPGIHIGYLICDDCSYPTEALHIIDHMMSTNQTSYTQCDSLGHPVVKAVLGARFSEVSITMARLLALYMVPQISMSSSADILDDKLRFPSFLRTVPSDVHQTKAIVRLMTYFHWDWIGTVSGDDDYGMEALRNFLLDAAGERICVDYQEVIPQYLNNDNSGTIISQVAQKIRSSGAQVVLIILKEELVMKLFAEMIRTNTTRIWIASDAWSLSGLLASMPGINNVGDIFGFSFMTGPNPGFSDFLQNLQPEPGSVNHFIEEYKNLRFGCTPEILEYRKCLANNASDSCPAPASLSFTSPSACNITDPQEANDDFLLQAVNINVTYSQRLAVWSLAHALKKLLNCNETVCQGDEDFPPWKLLAELKNISFTLDNAQFSFNENGSFSSGYDLINWVRDGSYRTFRTIGIYNISEDDLEIKLDEIDQETRNNTVLSFKCLPICPRGKVQAVSNLSCCSECADCQEGTFSDLEGQAECEACPNGTWSMTGSEQCQPRNETFFSLDDPYGIVLLTFECLGVLLLLVVLVIFLVARDSPPVKVAGGNLCYVMMAGLLVSFVGVIFFMLKPTDAICQIRQTMYGMGFTLCVSCILIKAFRTFLAFLFDLHQQHNLKKLYKPIIIIVLFTIIQGFICMFWLVFDSPRLDSITSNQSMEIQLQCIEGSGVGFSVMLSYIGLLAFICFLLAFKGRKVPHRFNETGYIIFSMLIYLFVWVCFIPIYITKNQQRSAVQASAIVVSNYGIIFCHFFPKCYMILCKKKQDLSLQAYLDKVSIFSITSSNLAVARASVDSGNGDMESVSTPNSMSSEVITASVSTMATCHSKDLLITESLTCLRRRLRSSSI
ncbi:G-protein coupled receptor family C group 6 member A-like [Brienomyrus brachyistius]|uniref:G-protein coupled receptor family C group 6 member A-like n=1 Tax=Brienomyrus brachyistius TaxID=42636 RepID=UPI0020B3A5E8|nr:G-protein coupled receptor family C group 6 member A-like [Brienomyrus brachyistius]